MKDVQHPGTTFPTLGIDFDNAGFPGNTGNPGVSAPVTQKPSEREGGPMLPGSVTRSRLDWHTSRPVTLNGSYQAAAAAATYCFLVFPQVTPNKIWEIGRIGVTAPDPFTTLAGVTVLAFRSSTIPQDTSTEPPTFGDLLAVLGSVPNTSYPGGMRAPVARGNERVVLAFKGLANAQQIQASMDITEHDLQAYLLTLLH
jgi:hypothetical protein